MAVEWIPFCETLEPGLNSALFFFSEWFKCLNTPRHRLQNEEALQPWLGIIFSTSQVIVSENFVYHSAQ